MLPDLTLAALHHLLVFGLVAMLASESALLRGPVDGATVRRLAGLDAGYGLTAVLLLVVGLLRVFYGAKGAHFYMHNPWFHAKLGTFLLVAVLSILPTARLLRWRRALRADPAFIPDAAEVARLRMFLRVQLLLIAAIFVLAAAMARYGGF
jgi:putative membrane protein